MTARQKKPSPKSVAPSPSWTLDHGVSYSLLSRFINCRERFRLYAVEGAREEKSSKTAMDWGTYFHELIELQAKNPNLNPAAIIKKTKRTITGLDKKVANLIFEQYTNWYEEEKHHYFAQEQVFDEDYRLPNGRVVRLVGKTDEIILNKDGSLMIQENKTKEKFDIRKIEQSIPHDLQSLMYAICIQQKFKRRVNGIVYNVIRKPSHKPKKITFTKTQMKENPKLKSRMETEAEFLKRLSSEIEENGSHFFHRWQFHLTEEHVERWRRQVFDPLLTQLCLWWDSVKHDPFSPWTTPAFVHSGHGPKPKLIANPHHYQRPFGVYDSMTTGVGDYFDLITRNLEISVTKGNPIFTELPEIQKINKKKGL